MSGLLTLSAMILAGLVCSFIDSTLGMGYGVSATSVFLTFGISAAIASASVHTSEAVVDLERALHRTEESCWDRRDC
jgi:uncharacterized membrane protein YfcA